MRQEDGKIIVSQKELQQKVFDVFLQHDVKREHAEIVADTIVEAEMRGVKSHGVNMLNAYLARIKCGGIDTGVSPVVIKDSRSTALIDARGSFGQVAGKIAMDLAIEKAREYSF